MVYMAILFVVMNMIRFSLAWFANEYYTCYEIVVNQFVGLICIGSSMMIA